MIPMLIPQMWSLETVTAIKTELASGNTTSQRLAEIEQQLDPNGLYD